MKYGKESCGTLLIAEGKVLLIKDKPKCHDPRSIKKCYKFPKGLREVGESRKQAAIRETREEVGINISLDKLSKSFVIEYEFKVSAKMLENHLKYIKKSGQKQFIVPDKNGKMKRRVTIYVVFLQKRPVVHVQASEIQSAKWFTWHEALSKIHWQFEPILRAAYKLYSPK